MSPFRVNVSVYVKLGTVREHFGRRAGDEPGPPIQTQLPRAVQEVATTRTARTLTHIAVPSGAGARLLEVKVLPVAGGVALLWHDITERTHAEHELKRNEERLALAAEGANDGLWEWDLRTQALYVSTRWKKLLGLPDVKPMQDELMREL